MTAPPVESPRTALVIDDNRDFLLAMEHFLATHAVGILKASNGAEGLAWIHHLAPTIIILDVNMPFMNGPEFLRQVRALGRPVPPIIAVTGDDRLDADAVRELGARAVLLKPFTADQLGAAIQAALTDHPPTRLQPGTNRRDSLGRRDDRNHLEGHEVPPPLHPFF